jgi:hypothetical protein
VETDLRWVLGIGISLTATMVTAIIAAFRNLAGRISTGNRDLHKRIDEVKDNYARRDDVSEHIVRMDNNLREIRDENRENHRQILEAVTRPK